MKPHSRSEDRFEDLSLERRERLRARDAGVMREFYDLYVGRVYAYVERLVGGREAAEDLTQEIFMHFWHAIERYDPRRPLRPWVFTIATNKVRDWWRLRRHEQFDSDESLAAVAQKGHLQRGPTELAQAVELSQIVATAVQDLPEIARTTLVLHYYEGLSFEEIGRIVGRSEVAVRKRYSRALAELRERLMHLEDNGEA